MHRHILVSFTLLCALIPLVGLPWLGWVEAERQGYTSAAEVATGYARDVLYRTDKTGAQAQAAVVELVRAGLEPCSSAELNLMEELDLASSYIQAIGRMRHGTMQCSSVGGLTLNLGNKIYHSPTGVTIYTNVLFGQQSGQSLMGLQLNDFVVFISPQLPIDTWTGSQDVALGIFQIDQAVSTEPDMRRGNVQRKWLQHLAGKSAASFVDGERLIAVIRSTQFRIAAVAALPITDITARRNATAMRLVPAGSLAGIIGAVAILLFARRQRSLATAMRSALRRKEFYLQYQPIIDLATKQCVGVEALLRWRRSTGELISPELFIPVAEESGLITSITNRVLELVQHDAGAWLAENPAFHIAINLSPVDLHSSTLIESLDRFMRGTGAHPSNLLLEITERGLVDVGLARQIIQALHERGYNIAIDDFGTGYSSLSYLESLDVDILKIDRSFVEAIDTPAPTRHVVGHIIAMASDIGLRIIAEGVERQAQVDYLEAHQVQYAQGWLFGRPIEFRAIVARIETQKAQAA